MRALRCVADSCPCAAVHVKLRAAPFSRWSKQGHPDAMIGAKLEIIGLIFCDVQVIFSLKPQPSCDSLLSSWEIFAAGAGCSIASPSFSTGWPELLKVH